MNYKRILNLFLILVLCLSFITPLFLITPVLAAEEEEEDNFTTMPNYRWENQSTTDSAVQEQLIGDNYEIYNANNQTSGTQKFEKSRQLISRDFYYESRFALDVGGNETEYFRDIVGDPCDFTEGDQEGWRSYGDTTDFNVVDGILSYETIDKWDGIQWDFRGDESEGIHSNFEIKVKASRSVQVYFFTRYDGSGTAMNVFTIGTSWDIYSSDIIDSIFDWAYFNTLSSETETCIFYVDFIELNGDLDYATHVEGEIGDTWDWEDSNEYFYDEESNISDFNDGTTEGWYNRSYNFDMTNYNGWLNVTAEEVASTGAIQRNGTYDADTYKYFAVELSMISGSIDFWRFLDVGWNILIQGDDNIVEGTTVLLSGVFDADWSGTETALIFYYDWVSNAIGNEFHLNFTFLYDQALGDLEGWSRVGGADLRYDFVNPEGYISVHPDSTYSYMYYSETGLNIDSELFTTIKVRIKANENGLRFGIRDSSNLLSSYYGLTTTFVEYTFDISIDSDWSGVETGIGIVLSELSGEGNFEGDERFDINYVLLTGHWSDSDGFKFSLLNADDEEGMSFKFTRPNHTVNEYNLSIDMYDSVGVALDYTYSFNYDMDVDGWLRLRAGWNLDKRIVKMLFEYDNGTDILKVGRITDLFGSYIGITNLLLLQDGFPSLCINNSMGALARSYVVINYIDADWSILDWREPVGTWTFKSGVTYTQNLDTDFTSVSPYGVEAFYKSVSDKNKFYVLTVDRFDGLSFDFDMKQEDIDQGDRIESSIAVYNVHKNGTLERLLLIIDYLYGEFEAPSGHTFYAYIGPDDDTDFYKGYASIDQVKGSISIYYESRSKVIMQFQIEGYLEDDNIHSDSGSFTAIPCGEEQFTKEMVVVFGYRVETDNSGAGDDIVSFRIGGFDLVRKDIIGSIVGAIIGPIIGLIAWLFSPFILLFQMLTSGIGKAFKDLFSNLEPLFGILGGVFGTVIGGLEEGLGLIIDGLGAAIGGFLTTLEEGLVLAFEGLWVLLFTLADSLGQFIIDVVDWLVPVLSDMINSLIGFIAAVIFWLWDALVLPDLLVILAFVITYFGGVLTNLPQIIADVATVLFFLGNLGLVLWWVWCVFLPVCTYNPAEAAGEIIDRFFKTAWPWDITGFNIYVPQGVLVLPLTYFLIINPAGGMYAIW